ncbi:MAG: hypothetical protein ACI4RL_03245, partial [Ruminococcus sp.]
DVMEPYSSIWYYSYGGANSFNMGGMSYYKGFTLKYNSFACFNFQGKYSKISFYYGGEDGSDDDMTAMFYNDGELVKNLRRTKNSLPKYYTINTRNTYQFKIETGNGWSWHAGFGNVKLYY